MNSETKVSMGLGAIVVVGIAIFLAVLFSSCVSSLERDADAGPDLGASLDLSGDLGTPSYWPANGSGHLPVGYYQRQCQWDACGGPLPDRQSGPATDPTR